MASKLTSPGSQTFEKNFSFYAPNITGSIPGIVGFASKGPIPSVANEEAATLITSQEQLIQVFGRPDSTAGGQGLLGALEILEKTDQLYYIRVATDDAVDASASVIVGLCPAVFVSGVAGAAVNVNVDVSGSDGTSKTNATIKIESTTNAANPWSSEFASDFNKEVGGAGAAKFIAINDNEGYIVGSYAGSGSNIQVSGNWANGAVVMGLYSAEIGNGAVAEAVSSVNQVGDQSSDLVYRAESIWSGAGYNYSAVEVAGTTRIFGNSIETEMLAGDGFTLIVNKDGAATEAFSMSMTPSSSAHPPKAIGATYDKLATSGSSEITAKFVSGSTDYTVPTSDWSDAIAGISLITGGTTGATGGRFMKPIESTTNMSGGVNGDQTGTVASVVADILGNPANKTGIYALDDDALPISLGIIPGYFNQDLQNGLISLAEATQKFLAVVAPPLGLDSAQQAIDWTNGKGNGRTASINSSWTAVYWPHVRVYDTFSRASVWVDPAVFAISQMAFTAGTAEVWFAPAGLTRGRLTKPTDVEVTLNVGDRNALYGTGNIINPIQKFTQDGIVIWGQRTGSRTASALDRVNVRLMMILLRQLLLVSSRADVFEPNDPILWLTVKNKAESILRDIQRRRGITDFQVVVDETVNTPLRIDRNELWAKILLKPTKAAEIISFELNLTSQDADFGAQ